MESDGTHYLHSENRGLGSGSGQQIVTWIPNKSTINALWLVRGANNNNLSPQQQECNVGTPIKCGSTLRLTHLETMRNLHTHNIPSPLSKQQEISGFGENGHGDSGDDWIVECSTENWMRGQPVRLLHVDTKKYLAGSSNVKFTQQNCGHSCPILHQLEAFGRKQKDDFSLVKVELGVHLSV
jgi:dolichyl-phosphate-mannose--protein O-mannosyl transferase